MLRGIEQNGLYSARMILASIFWFTPLSHSKFSVPLKLLSWPIAPQFFTQSLKAFISICVEMPRLSEGLSLDRDLFVSGT
jgi:hypothetical protein